MGQKIFEKCRQKRSCDIKKDRTISEFFLLFSMKIEMFFYGKLPKEFRKIGSRSSYFMKVFI